MLYFLPIYRSTNYIEIPCPPYPLSQCSALQSHLTGLRPLSESRQSFQTPNEHLSRHYLSRKPPDTR